MNKLFLIIPALCIVLITPNVYASFAPVQTPNIIYVMETESCHRQINLGVKNNCPNASELIKFDTSNQEISGHLIISKSGDLSRTKAIKNHWVYYSYMPNSVVCVECDIANNADSVRKIVLLSSDFTFIAKNEAENKGKITLQNSRAMEGCNTATIHYTKELLNDTIRYMRSGCLSSMTNFNGNTTKILPNSTPFIMGSKFSTIIQTTFLNHLLNGHIFSNNHTMGGFGPGLCINGHVCNFADPYKKW